MNLHSEIKEVGVFVNTEIFKDDNIGTTGCKRPFKPGSRIRHVVFSKWAEQTEEDLIYVCAVKKTKVMALRGTDYSLHREPDTVECKPPTLVSGPELPASHSQESKAEEYLPLRSERSDKPKVSGCSSWKLPAPLSLCGLSGTVLSIQELLFTC